MFILRRITSEGNESNQIIGDSYNEIHSTYNEAEFKKTEDLLLFPAREEIYAYIAYKEGSEIMPLYRKSNYYMMTENGVTFKNLSLKK